MTTAWMFGGKNVTFEGHGIGTFDGNGQLWFVASVHLLPASEVTWIGTILPKVSPTCQADPLV